MGRKSKLDKREEENWEVLPTKELSQEQINERIRKYRDVDMSDVVDKFDADDSVDVVEQKVLDKPLDVDDVKAIEAKRRKALRNEVTHKLRFEVLERDRHTCVYCGDSPKKNSECKLVVDHVVPIEKGGTNDLTNLVTSCYSCNEGKKDKLLHISGFEREYKLHKEEILFLAEKNAPEDIKAFLLDNEHNEDRLYLYDIYRQKNITDCERDCVGCINSGKDFYHFCFTKLYQKAKFNVDDRRGIGETNEQETSNILTAAANKLQCDTCYASRRCPKYRVGASCSFDFEGDTDFLDTKEAFRIILNTQKKRIIRAAFFETIDGGALDKNLSNEIALAAQLMKAQEEITKNKNTVGIEFKATGQGEGAGLLQGIMSSIFGGGGQNQLPENKTKEIPANASTDNAVVIEESTVKEPLKISVKNE